mmetsp:Transcript_6572/g.11814  ORF Transcript_6572/g.11814 Transcript_6572/m.11814 type:complete len:104 (-) Transcript_6572:253-564(-)
MIRTVYIFRTDSNLRDCSKQTHWYYVQSFILFLVFLSADVSDNMQGFCSEEKKVQNLCAVCILQIMSGTQKSDIALTCQTCEAKMGVLQNVGVLPQLVRPKGA